MTDEAEKVQLKALRALLKVPGALMMVRHSHRCGIPSTHADPVGLVERRLCQSYPYPEGDWRHYNLSPISEITGPDGVGCYTATTEDGSMVYGKPSALLANLQRHLYEGDGPKQSQ